MNIKDIEKDIQTRGGKYRYRVVSFSMFANEAEMKKVEKEKQKLESSGWNLFESNVAQSIYAKLA